MLRGAILADTVLHGSFRMADRNMLVARITGNLAGPEEQRDIQHAVDDDPAIFVFIPGADEFACGIIAGGQEVGGLNPSAQPVLVASQRMLDDSRRQKLKTHIMMQLHRRFNEPFLQSGVPMPSRFFILFFSGHVMHDPEKAGPEAGGPPVGSHIIIFAVHTGKMRTFAADLLCHACYLRIQFVHHFLPIGCTHCGCLQYLRL
ncbi:hypothetical protein D3C73_1160130 [compost metagenome]